MRPPDSGFICASEAPTFFTLGVEFCLKCLLLDSRSQLLAPELIGSKGRTDPRKLAKESLHLNYPSSENAIKKNLSRINEFQFALIRSTMIRSKYSPPVGYSPSEWPHAYGSNFLFRRGWPPTEVEL